MVKEPFMDMLDTNLDFLGGRCLICGEIVDAGILDNRRRMRSQRSCVGKYKRAVPA
jgi:hypothetical protein